MAVDRNKYRQLKNGVGHEAALILADPAKTPQQAATMTMTAPATMNAAYTQAEVQNLRNDVNTLITRLKNAGVML